jgi:hypothetical protein
MLRVDEAEVGRMTLQGGAGVVTPAGEDGRPALMRTGDDIAAGESPSVAAPDNARENRALADRPEMKRKVTLVPPPTDKKAAPPQRITTADLLEAVHRATGEDVIGDYFTRLFDASGVLPGPAAGEPLFDVLSRACDRARLRWRKGDDGWLGFRSVGFFNDRPKEVPNRFLEQWAEARRANHDVLPLDSLLDMAAVLSDAQLDASAMAEGAKTLYGLAEWDQVRSGNVRGSWRLVAGLTPKQRQRLLSAGVGFSELTVGQQQAFAREVFLDPSSPGAALEGLAAATLRVRYAADPPGAAGHTARFTYRYRDGKRDDVVMRRLPSGISQAPYDPKEDGPPAAHAAR